MNTTMKKRLTLLEKAIKGNPLIVLTVDDDGVEHRETIREMIDSGHHWKNKVVSGGGGNDDLDQIALALDYAVFEQKFLTDPDDFQTEEFREKASDPQYQEEARENAKKLENDI